MFLFLSGCGGAGGTTPVSEADLTLTGKDGLGTYVAGAGPDGIFVGTEAGDAYRVDASELRGVKSAQGEGCVYSDGPQILGIEDVTGDGIADVAAGMGTGAVLYSGDECKPAALAEYACDGDCTLVVGGTGDPDADGIPDLFLGAPDLGSAYLVPGDHHGAVTVSSAGGVALGGADGVAGLGAAGLVTDLDGDGVSDVVAAAVTVSGSEGGAFVFLGPIAENRTSDTAVRLDGWAAKNGHGVAAGDLNGDGYGDVVLGGSDSVGIFLGPFAGGSGEANVTLTGPEGAQAGADVAAPGDITGDGEVDILVGAPGVDRAGAEGAGAAWVVEGPFAGGTRELDNERTWFVGESAGQQVGASVASAGDVDGDGTADVIVGAPGGDAAYLFLGGGE